MDWLELTEQEGGSDDELAGSEVVCDFEGRRKTAKYENGLADDHGAAPPPTIRRRVCKATGFREDAFIIISKP